MHRAFHQRAVNAHVVSPLRILSIKPQSSSPCLYSSSNIAIRSSHYNLRRRGGGRRSILGRHSGRGRIGHHSSGVCRGIEFIRDRGTVLGCRYVFVFAVLICLFFFFFAVLVIVLIIARKSDRVVGDTDSSGSAGKRGCC